MTMTALKNYAAYVEEALVLKLVFKNVLTLTLIIDMTFTKCQIVLRSIYLHGCVSIRINIRINLTMRIIFSSEKSFAVHAEVESGETSMW